MGIANRKFHIFSAEFEKNGMVLVVSLWNYFNYYQAFRMKEASYLLREQKLSVADVGSKLGFTKLSHFSKVFAAHIGMKPKQHSKS